MTTVSPDSSTHLSAPARTIPIIVVPGIMGTRLSNPDTDELVWNPLGGVLGRSPGNLVPSLFNSQWERLNDLAPLDPVESTDWSGYPQDRAAKATWIKHFYNLIPDSYDDLCFALKDDLAAKLKPLGLVPRVYGAGYDWRQDNAVSADTHLARVVKEAQAECGHEKVILVAHSQGGLVSRYFCKKNESSVLALFLLGSPSLGAVQPYVRLKRGIVGEDGASFVFLRTELHLGAEGSRDLLRRFPSMYQLMPNAIYCREHPEWLMVDVRHTGRSKSAPLPGGASEGETSEPSEPTFSDARCGYDTYRDLYAGLLEVSASRDLYAGHIDTAERFHAALTTSSGAAYVPPITFCICTTDIDTPSVANVLPYGHFATSGEVVEYVADYPAEISLDMGAGDESVNAFSCDPSSVVSPAFAVASDVNGGHAGVAHGDLPNDPDVIRLVIDHIVSLFPPGPPAPEPTQESAR